MDILKKILFYCDILELSKIPTKKEKNHGVVNRKGEVTLYFYKSYIINSMKNGTWTEDGNWRIN